MDRLPLELKCHVASLVGSQQDVSHLCLVSLPWLHAGRPILYKKLVLRVGSGDLKETLRLLNSNPILKKSVVELSITRMKSKVNVGTVLIDSVHQVTLSDLLGMENIRTASVLFFQRTSPKSLQEIVRYIYEASPKLNEIHFSGRELEDVSSLEELIALPNIPLNLTNVSVLGTDISGRMLMTTFFANSNSITTLSIFHITSYNQDLLRCLSDLKLPKLDNFSATVFITDSATMNPLVSFLAAHPTIRTCSLQSAIGLGYGPLSPLNILPNLTSLSADLRVIHDLSNMSDFLCRISFLTIDDERARNASFLESLQVQAERPDTFTDLVAFKTTERDPAEIAIILESLVAAIENLEYCSFPALFAFKSRSGKNTRLCNYNSDIEKIIAHLICFERLERLDLHEGSLFPTQIDLLFRKIAALQRIYIYGPDSLSIEIKILERLSKDESSTTPTNITRMYRTIDRTLSRVWWEAASL